MNWRHQPRSPGRLQRGSALIEFTVIAPVLTLLGMGVTQYALMFNAKNMVNHASFMAARAGSLGNASLAAVEATYARALIPLYGGGRSTTELAESYAKAVADLKGRARFELINPTKESFDDWSDGSLNAQHGGKRAIRNSGLAFRADGVVKPASGQSLQDANLIKLKITHGYELKVPLIGKATAGALALLDKGNDPFVTSLYAQGRIPLVSHVTLQMQSDPVEPDKAVTVAGAAKDSNPDNTSSPPRSQRLSHPSARPTAAEKTVPASQQRPKKTMHLNVHQAAPFARISPVTCSLSLASPA